MKNLGKPIKTGPLEGQTNFQSKLSGVNQYVSPITGFLGMAATSFDNKKLGKIAKISGDLSSIATDITAPKLPKMRKGGKMKKKNC